MKHAILLFTLWAASAALRAGIPILGFWGVDPENATKARYAEMRRAGFDISMDGYKSLEQIVRALDCAQAAGMKLLVAGDQLVLYPRETAEAIRNHPALFGYVLGDEPRMKDFEAYKKRFDAISAADAEGLFVEMCGELLSGRGNPANTEAVRRERALYQIACKAAIKGGRLYDDSVIVWLIEKLLALPDITVCPHGRPVAYKVRKRELDRQFDRIK